MKLKNSDITVLENHLWKLVKTSAKLPRYEEISMPLFGMIGHNPHFWEGLGKVTERTLKSHGVALSAIVVNGDGVPGDDFYPLIGLNKPRGQHLPASHMKAWSSEIAKIYKTA